MNISITLPKVQADFLPPSGVASTNSYSWTLAKILESNARTTEVSYKEGEEVRQSPQLSSNVSPPLPLLPPPSFDPFSSDGKSLRVVAPSSPVDSDARLVRHPSSSITTSLLSYNGEHPFELFFPAFAESTVFLFALGLADSDE